MPNPLSTQFAAVFSVSHTVLFAAGVCLVLAGMYLQLKVGYYRMEAEERMKDRRISEEQARRRIALIRYSAPLLMLAGAVAFVILFWT